MAVRQYESLGAAATGRCSTRMKKNQAPRLIGR